MIVLFENKYSYPALSSSSYSSDDDSKNETVPKEFDRKQRSGPKVREKGQKYFT